MMFNTRFVFMRTLDAFYYVKIMPLHIFHPLFI
jgi:hypothetical protein